MKVPSEAEQLALHRRMLAREPDAPVAVFQAFMEPILRVLRRRGHREDPDVYATDAIFSYVQNPRCYDGSRSRLSTFLTRVALNKALDQQRSRKSELRRRKRLGEIVEKVSAPNGVLEARIDLRKFEASLKDPKDRAVFKLMVQGERNAAAYAEAVGAGHRPKRERIAVAKQQKDRVLKKLQRRVKRERGGQPLKRRQLRVLKKPQRRVKRGDQ